MRNRNYSNLQDERVKDLVLNKKSYPNYPEYILLDLIKEETVFKRGACSNYIHHEEFNTWQEYFCGDYYEKPQGKRIAFLQVCSWAKPYDFSYIGKKIREVTNKYPMVHPIILSNAGIIPYEYQMNPTFCAYDWMDDIEDPVIYEELMKEYRDKLIQRIRSYLESNSYDVVVQYGIPVKKYSMAPVIKDICKDLGITFLLTPDIETYRNNKDKLVELKDSGEFYCLDEVLSSMDNCLNKVSRYVESINCNTGL
ncbi:TPA: DUF5591 domain-containing protein [Bacillus toyonensis]|uniref:DUF5591 domain-containing protein n=1 Tax=Bacillus cereus group TaxID=86661 RepID=UPI00103FD6F7|nr:MULTISPECIES: DUF5591 domain-containing protein [Bacillus cereus group]MBJ8066906.1 DUF5591 domain-containing protein [Bacillus cereus group sp. N15]TBX46407.1 radical SAM protein [Bacillus toyonensis]HDR7447998.1 DUF5591 domain-containing protein [Bacillus toyonensis]